MGTSHTFRRVALGAAVLATTVIASATRIGSRAGAASGGASSPVRGGSPQSVLDRVADFYGAYIDVLYDSGRSPLADSLRDHYLTTDLRDSLARWEATRHQDGVLQAKDIPITWSVAYNDSGMGHCWSRVTLTWQDGNQAHRTRLMVQSNLATRLISGIKADQ
ncbi:hypothetical protein [Streptomyces sp. NPDC007172]|uniref:hypothetical protein n=1 Tax=Streptomyces sp. NPDC007172 TaxID=3364776 RepID=UPI0036A49DEA